jgi:hypothetical protein
VRDSILSNDRTAVCLVDADALKESQHDGLAILDTPFRQNFAEAGELVEQLGHEFLACVLASTVPADRGLDLSF